MTAVTSLMRVQQILMAHLNTVLEPFDLTFPRYETLMLLYYSRTGALPMGKIGERLQVHPTSVTSLVDRLERHRYVVREPHSTDRRAVLARITQAGSQVAQEASRLLNTDQFGLGALRREQQEKLTVLLAEVRKVAGDEVGSAT